MSARFVSYLRLFRPCSCLCRPALQQMMLMGVSHRAPHLILSVFSPSACCWLVQVHCNLYNMKQH